MGAWSIHAFANDDAAEFIAELQKADSDEPLSRAIATVNGSMGYLDASDAARALAAAEFVAAGLGRPCSALEGEEAAAAWFARTRFVPAPSLVADTRRAVERVLAGESELRNRWEDSADAGAWKAEVAGLRERLG